MTPLSCSPFQEVYQGVYQAMLASMPDTGFILKAPVILPYSDMKATTFIITSNPGDHIDVYVNDNLVRTLIASEARFSMDLQLPKGYSYIRLQGPLESFKLVVALTDYATLYAAWADQYFDEIGVNLQDLSRNLNSRWSLKQVEHQIVWQDLLPGTRMMRILAGKMAVKSLMNCAPTDEGILDLAKALTGTTPVVLPTLLDTSLYEPECRLLYASAQDFAGYEFNLWLFNLCAASWQAFVVLMNNLDDDVYRLLTVSDQHVTLQHNGAVESHVFDLAAPQCSIVNILTQFLDCFSRIKVFVQSSILDEFSVCAYGYPLDLAVSNPIGYLRFDSGIVLDNNPQLPFDSTDPSDPYTDGLLGLPITCRFDSGNLLNSLDPQVVPGADCPAAAATICGFLEPCASGSVQALMTLNVGAQPGMPVLLGGSSSGLPNLWVVNGTVNLRRLAPLTRAVNATVVLGSASVGVAVGAGSLWATAGANVSRVDPNTQAILATYVLGGTVERLAWDAVRGLMLSVSSLGAVQSVDPLTAIVTTRVPGLQPLSSIRLIGRVLYLTSTSGDTVYAYNADTYVQMWMKVLPALGPADVMEANGNIWVACTNGTVVQLDPLQNHKVVSVTAAATGANRFTWVSTVQQWWVTGPTDNRVWFLDPAVALPSASVVYTLAAGAFPNSAWVAGGQIFYTANVDGSVSVIDAVGGTVVTNAAVVAAPADDIVGT